MAVGVLIVAHYQLGEQFLQSLRLILPDAPAFASISIEPGDSLDEIKMKIQEELISCDVGDGVLVLTDMFGGTPSNISLSFHDPGRIEIVTGLNLPMLIKLATLDEEKTLEELAVFVKDYGRRNISVASELLPGSEGSS